MGFTSIGIRELDCCRWIKAKFHLAMKLTKIRPCLFRRVVDIGPPRWPGSAPHDDDV